MKLLAAHPSARPLVGGTDLLRFEFFHPKLNHPAPNISATGSVGRITSAQDPRQIPFGAKILFQSTSLQLSGPPARGPGTAG